MKHLIDMSADRGAFICQSQSLNLWMKDPDYQRLTSMHFYSWKKGLKTGLYYFGGQLLINGLWSLIFFGLTNPILGLLVIVILLFLILRTIKWFRAIDRLSAQILYPYFIWVIFATLLNAGIVFLNYK